MDNSSAIQEGWDFIVKNQIAAYASFKDGAIYVEMVDKAVQQLTKDMDAVATELGIGQMKGFIAEYFHADTFNINAALKGSSNRAIVEGSNQHASVDISTNFGKDYSLKYYATGKASVRNQAKNVIQAYHEYAGKSKAQSPLSFEEYLQKYGYSNDEAELMKSVYYGQGRIIPSDQLEEACDYLKRKIEAESVKEGMNRTALYESYLETLEQLSDRIKDGEGVESIPLTKDEAEILAKLAKSGEFRSEDLGFSLSELISTEYILQQALKAGTTAAVITLVTQIAPEIFKAINYLIRNGEIDKEQLKEIGLKAITASAEGFLSGSVSAAITIICKAGKLGSALTNVSPGVVGAVTVIVMDTLKNSCMVACGKMSFRDMEMRLTKELLISATSLASGTIGQMILPELPVLGYMLGSLLGSVVGLTVIHVSEKAILSFCANTGFALFGLVEQNYEMPQKVLERLGIESMEFKVANYKKAVYKTQSYETIGFTVLRRGVIAVNRIGYV